MFVDSGVVGKHIFLSISYRQQGDPNELEG